MKAIDAFGVESPEPLSFVMRGGSAVAHPPHGTAKIVFSTRRSAAPAVPQDITHAQRIALTREWARSRAAAQPDLQPELPLAALPMECTAFIRSIEKVSPRQQLEQIEKFVREKSYYDFENDETRDVKRGISNTERFALMRSRVAELASRDPEKAKFLRGKLFAGVCADFALVTATLQQAAGFVGGVMEGFRVDGTSAGAAQSHAISWVAWPAEHASAAGTYRIITLDGTPSGATPEEQKLLAQVQQPSLASRAAEAEKIAAAFDAAHAEEFENIVRTLRENNPAQIKSLTNGMVERAVNAVLHHEARHTDARVIEHVLDVLLYSPVSLERLDWKHVQSKVAVLGFVDSELTRERSLHVAFDSGKPAGVKIMNAFSTFLEKFHRRYPAAPAGRAFEVLEQVFDGIRGHLDPVEYRIALVVLTYLRAKKMVGSN